MKRACESSADRITDLPVEVIQRILVFLPIKDAAKTTVLSRKWRHQWSSVPQLVFDCDFTDITEEAESVWEVMSKQVILNIYQCLLLHDGQITKFELSIPGLVPCQEINLIILYLSNKGIQHFTLEFRCVHNFLDLDYYRMHSSLFSVPHLKSLKLLCCKFATPTWFDGFSKLTCLHFDEVILPYDFFQNFLPKCPMLESLKIVSCEGFAGKLELVAPFLKSLYIWGSLDICFKSTPLLSDVSLHLTDGGIPDMVSLFASLPGLQRFSVNCEILKYLGAGDRNVPTRLPTPLHQLKVLHMDFLVFDSLEMERVFVCLIMSSPNLHRLTVEVRNSQLDVQPSNDEVTCIWRLLEAEVCPDCLQHLVEFRIDCRGTQVELDLVMFVLATAPLLRMVHVRPGYKMGTKKVMELMKKVMRYKRVSKEAEIIFDWEWTD